VIRSIVLVAGIATAACASTRRADETESRTFHLLDRVDAWNLGLAPDGVYVVDVHGCDFFGTMCGRWEARGDDVVLLPAAGAERMWWPGSEGSSIVDVITLHATPDGYAASGTDGETAIAQRWARGRVCPDCETGGGPSGLHACPTRIPDRSRCGEPPPSR
jgi:hypothetical protein